MDCFSKLAKHQVVVIELSVLSKLLNRADESDVADIKKQMKVLENKLSPLEVKDYYDERTVYQVKSFFDTEKYLLKNYRTRLTDSGDLRLFKFNKLRDKKDSYPDALNAVLPEDSFKGPCYHLEECFQHITNIYVNDRQKINVNNIISSVNM